MKGEGEEEKKEADLHGGCCVWNWKGWEVLGFL